MQKRLANDEVSARVETRQDKKRKDKTRQDKTRQDKTRQDKTRQDKTRQDKGRILLPNLFVLTQQIVTELEEVKAFFFELFFDISFLFFDCMLLTSYQLHLLMLMGSSEFH